MPTISRLPQTGAASAADLIPISQGGSTYAVSVGTLLSTMQPEILVDPPCLLGRVSMGAGGPDAIGVGSGLILNNFTLSASGIDISVLSAQTSLSADDHIVVANAQGPHLAAPGLFRSIFVAGHNISIDSNGTISALSLGSLNSSNIASTPEVPLIEADDLVGISQGGTDHSISYANLLNGFTIDQAEPAGPAADGDSFWVAQTNNTMLRQTLTALWPWVVGKLPLWKRPVVELSVNTTLDGIIHNNSIVICTQPLLISALPANLGSGFSCQLINLGNGSVVLQNNIMSSNNTGIVAPAQKAVISSAIYSAGSIIYAAIEGITSVQSAPGQPSALTVGSLTSSGAGLAWLAPAGGGPASFYQIKLRTTGTTVWSMPTQNVMIPEYTIEGLQPNTSYDFEVIAVNSGGPGPASSVLSFITLATGSVPGAPVLIGAVSAVSNDISCSWSAPTSGGTALDYLVQYRMTSQSVWINAASNLSSTSFVITGLLSQTSYDIQIIASNMWGMGPASAILTAVTAAGSVTNITWNVLPSGIYTHGTGSIGVNAHVNPSSAIVRFGFSTSQTIQPQNWTVGVNVNTDLWGAYVPTPLAAGSWYAWVEGIDGSSPLIGPAPFTVV